MEPLSIPEIRLYYSVMAGRVSHLIDDRIRFILLDMDGTLLDRHFDDYFWEHLLPERYSKQNGVSFEEAKRDLLGRFRKEEGTLRWTDLDYWSENLGIDIPALKEQTKHLIEVHPFVIPFLEAMRTLGKEIVLVTNAHTKVLKIKLQETELGVYLDRVITSGEIGHPKEQREFWQLLGKILGSGYESRSLLVDDTEAVLSTARDFGIHRVIFKAGANSQIPVSVSSEFLSIEKFEELIP